MLLTYTVCARKKKKSSRQTTSFFVLCFLDLCFFLFLHLRSHHISHVRSREMPRNGEIFLFSTTPFVPHFNTITIKLWYLGFTHRKKVRRKFTPTPTPTTSRAHVCGVRVRDRDRDRDGDMSVCQKQRKFRSRFSFRR